MTEINGFTAAIASAIIVAVVALAVWFFNRTDGFEHAHDYAHDEIWKPDLEEGPKEIKPHNWLDENTPWKNRGID